MTKSKFTAALPWLVLLLGDLGMGLRRWLYAAALDDRGLLPILHPLEICLWLLTAATLALILVTVWKLDGDGAYANNFYPSPMAAVGQAAAAAGILITVLTTPPMLSGLLGRLWKIFGILSFPCLLAAAYCRFRGTKPFFLLHGAPCLFLIFHIVNHYRFWSGRPQLMSYVFTLFGTITMALFILYTMSFEVELPRRRMQLATGLMTVYFCAVGLSDMRYPWLYLGMIAWAVTGLCTLDPKPLPPRPEEPGKEPKA